MQDEDEENDDDNDDDDDDEEIENGGGRVDQKRGGKKVTMKPLRRERKGALTTDEIHRVLLNSIMEEANTNVVEEPVKKPHEREDTRSSSNSSDDDSDGETDTKNPLEEELDSIYRMMDFCLADDDNNAAAAAAACLEDDSAKNQEQLCREGKHYLILDEEIGVICKFCSHVREEIKYVIPPFHENPFGVSDRSGYFMYDYQGAKNLPYFEDPNVDSQHSRKDTEFDPTGTVWEIIPDIRKTLYPHQREAFEFIWRNVDGGTKVEELMRNKTSEGGGCIISHAPGTGKTRLAIAFLETHMRLYKSSNPIILAPASILLTWKKEFDKWKVEVPFINLNDNDLSEEESSIAKSLFGKNYEKNLTYMAKRLIKMLCWKKHESVLAISYSLFTQLAREKKDGTTTSSRFLDQQEKLKELLLEKPGLLILDEGHMPRNERSLMFKILKKVKTKKRVLLSGTPFQNNFRELYNLLCLVRKEFVAEGNPFKKSSVDEADKAKIREFKEKIRPFYHRYSKYIIDAQTPGLFDNVIYLQPSKLQNKLLKEEEKTKKCHLKANVNMTLISVHPMLLHCKDTNPDFLQELKNGSWNIEDGAKTRFLIRLIELSTALQEKVLVFSQYLHPLNFVKALLMSEDYFGWREGVEIQFMSGNQDMETRHKAMEYFNKSGSKAKVMLASTKACSEGIELTGASRVVLLDVTWNPSVEEQAISRAYRMGQKKVVHVYHLIMTDNDSNRHISQTQKKNFSDYMFLESNKKIGSLGSSKADCEDIILERLLEEKIIKKATQERASGHPGPSNGF